MNLPGVPESVQWDTVREFLASLCLPLDDITRDGVHIGWDAIKVDLFARNVDGTRYADGDEAAIHSICIPLIHAD